MKVREIMKRPHIVKEDISLGEASQIMSNKRLTSLLYVVSNELRGILTERDLLKNFGKNKKISQVMTQKVFTIGPNENLLNVLNIMQKKRVKKLPVVKNKKLVGIVNLTDIAFYSDEIGESFFFE